jgi:hypothetical protein
MSKSNNLLEIWDTYRNSVILEKKSAKIGVKSGPGARELNDEANKKFQHNDSGPENADGIEDILDTRKKSSKSNKDSKDIVKFSLSDEKIDEGIEKTTSITINNYMKSIFDKLFEEVMNDQELQDAEALGVDVADDSAADTDTEMTESEVTVTLKPEHVECLRQILAQIDGDAGEDTEEDEEHHGDEEHHEDEEYSMGEAVEAEEIGHAIKDEDKLNKGFTKAKNNEVGTVKAVKGKADGKFTDKVGSDGTLADSKGEALTKHSNNKVSAPKIKAGASAFE